jgi:hypothetical protein
MFATTITIGFSLEGHGWLTGDKAAKGIKADRAPIRSGLKK